MRFFERLAPSARIQHAVQPALPPRFARMSAGVEDIHGDALMSPADAAPSIDAPDRRVPREAPKEASHDATTPERTMPKRVETIEAAASMRPAPHSAPLTGASVPPRSTAVPVLHTLDTRSHAPALSRREDLPRPSLQRDGTPVPSMPQRPLSPMALARRVQRETSESTVVHVTIDRIDVRAPAPSKPPRVAAKPRATPTMSLADYLRRGRS